MSEHEDRQRRVELAIAAQLARSLKRNAVSHVRINALRSALAVVKDKASAEEMRTFCGEVLAQDLEIESKYDAQEP
jgi:hypothetical protein